MNVTDFKQTKKGDRVWDYHFGWGTVIDVNYNVQTTVRGATNYASRVVSFFEVTFDGYTQTMSYDVSGHLLGIDYFGDARTLFWDGVEFEVPTKPHPNIPVNTRVLVWDDGMNNRIKRHFSHFDEDGMVHVFWCGESSWTSCGETTAYQYYEVIG